MNTFHPKNRITFSIKLFFIRPKFEVYLYSEPNQNVNSETIITKFHRMCNLSFITVQNPPYVQTSSAGPAPRAKSSTIKIKSSSLGRTLECRSYSEKRTLQSILFFSGFWNLHLFLHLFCRFFSTFVL